MKGPTRIYEAALADGRFQLENIALRWMLVALYAIFAFTGVIEVDRTWFAISEGFLVAFHAYYTWYVWHELTRDPFPEHVAYTTPFLDTVSVSLALIATGNALHPIWGAYFFIIAGISFFYHSIARVYALWLVASYATVGVALELRGLNPSAPTMLVAGVVLLAGMHNLIAYTGSERRLRRRVEEVARKDPLTDLLNRRGLEDALAQCMEAARVDGNGPAVLMLDIDWFKRLNDSYGHLAADGVLEQLGRTLTEAVRRPDLVARYGGDEFVLIIPEVSAEEATRLADRLRLQIERLGLCTVSIGVSVAGTGEPATEVLDRADAALMEAKQSGRNAVRAYGEGRAA